MFNIFLMWSTFNFNGKSKMKKNRNGDICKGALDMELERDWSVALGATLGNGHRDFFFFNFRDFSGKSWLCHIVGVWMYYKPTKFNQNRKSHFWKKNFFYFFLMWTALNFRGRGKTKKKTARDIYKRTPDIEFERDRSIGLGSTIGDRQTDTYTFFLKHVFRLWEWCRIKNH